MTIGSVILYRQYHKTRMFLDEIIAYQGHLVSSQI